MPIRYGKRLIVTQRGAITTTREEVYANFNTVKEIEICSETVQVKTDQDILAEFLKLMDRKKAGEIDLIGLQLLRDKNTGNMRVELSWAVPELQ